MAITYRGERFSGYNKPKRTPGKSKKFAVLAKVKDQIKLIRFKEGSHLEQDINATPIHQANLHLGIGLVKNGNEKKTKMGVHHTIVFVF
jgi:hypothetical protein